MVHDIAVHWTAVFANNFLQRARFIKYSNLARNILHNENFKNQV